MSDFHFFTDYDLIDIQATEDSFGERKVVIPNSNNEEDGFSVSSMHKAKFDSEYSDSNKFICTINNRPKAYSICNGELIIVPVIKSNILNIIFKPISQAQNGLPKIKYFIYRGILAESLFKFDLIQNKYKKNEDEIDLPDNSLLKLINKTSFNDSIINYLFNSGNDFPPIDLTTISLDNLFLSNNVAKIKIEKGSILGEFVSPENNKRKPINYNNSHNVTQNYNIDQGYFGLEIIVESDSFEPKIEDIRRKLSANTYSVDNCNRTIILKNFDNNYIEFKSNGATTLDAYKIHRNKERILNFIDPCAFWGSFIDNSIDNESKILLTANSFKRGIKTEADKFSSKDVYNFILLGVKKQNKITDHKYYKFEHDNDNSSHGNYKRRNTIYIDIRDKSNNSYGYNLNKFFYEFNTLQQIYDSSGSASYDKTHSILVLTKNDEYQSCEYNSRNYTFNPLIGWPILKFQKNRFNDGFDPSYEFNINFNEEEGPYNIDDHPEILKNKFFHIGIKLNTDQNTATYSTLAPFENANNARIFIDNKTDNPLTNGIIRPLNGYITNKNDSETFYLKVNVMDELDDNGNKLVYPTSTYFRLYLIDYNDKIEDLQTIDTNYNGEPIEYTRYSNQGNLYYIERKKNINELQNKSLEIEPFEYFDSLFSSNLLNFPSQSIINSLNYSKPLVIKQFESVTYYDNSRAFGNEFWGDMGVAKDPNNDYYFFSLENQISSDGFIDLNTKIVDFEISGSSANNTFLDYIGRESQINIREINKYRTFDYLNNKALTIRAFNEPLENFVFFKINDTQFNAIRSSIEHFSNNENIIDPLFKIYLGFKIVNFIPNNVNIVDRTGCVYQLYIRGHKTVYENGTYSIYEVRIPIPLTYDPVNHTVSGNIEMAFSLEDKYNLTNAKDIDNNSINDSYILNKFNNLNTGNINIEIKSTIYFNRSLSVNKKEFKNLSLLAKYNIEKVWSNSGLLSSNQNEKHGNRGLYSTLKDIYFKNLNGEWIQCDVNDNNKKEVEKMETQITNKKSTGRNFQGLKNKEIIFSIGNHNVRSHIIESKKAGRINIGDVLGGLNVAAHEYGHLLGLADSYAYVAQTEDNIVNTKNIKVTQIGENYKGFSIPIIDLNSDTLNGYDDSMKDYFMDYKWIHNIMSTSEEIPNSVSLVANYNEKQYIDRYWNDFPVNTGFYQNLDNSNDLAVGIGKDIITIFITKKQLNSILSHTREATMSSNQGVFFYELINNKQLNEFIDIGTTELINSKGTFCGLFKNSSNQIINITDWGYNSDSKLPNSNIYTPLTPPTTTNIFSSPSEEYTIPIGQRDDGNANIRISKILESTNNNIYEPIKGRNFKVKHFSFENKNEIIEIRKLLSNGSEWVLDVKVKTFDENPINDDNIDEYGIKVWNYKNIFGNTEPLFIDPYFNVIDDFNPSIVLSRIGVPFNRVQNNSDNLTFYDKQESLCNYYLNRYLLIILKRNGKL